MASLRKCVLLAAFLIICVAIAIGCRSAQPTPPTQPPSATAPPIAEATATPSPTPTPNPTATPTPLPQPTSTPTPSPTPAPLYLEGWRNVAGTDSLERTKPGLAEMIIVLPWVSDGISTSEREVVGRLVNAAMLDEPVFLAVIDRPWVMDGLNSTEQGILQNLTRFSNEAVASLIPGMPFMETVESEDSSTMSRLLTLDSQAPRLLSAIVELTWVEDGINGSEPGAIRWLRNFSDANVALSVIALGWVQDGIEDAEIAAVEELSYIDYDDSEVAASIVALPWVQDGVNDTEFDAIDWVNNFGGGEAAAGLVTLSWIQDGIQESEIKTIQELSYIDYDDSEVAAAVIALPWVQDGIEDLEFEAIDWINNFSSTEAMTAVVALGWVRDGIQELEVKTIQELSYIDYDDPAVAASVASLAWVQDGVQDVEFEAINWINNFGSGEAMASVVALGWVQDSIEELEVKTIQELSYIAYDDEELASSVINLAWVQDGIEYVEWEAIDWVNNFNGAEAATQVVALGWVKDGIEELEARTIQELSYINHDDSDVALSVVLMHWVQDGITDVEADAVDWLSNFSDVEAEPVVALAWVKDGIEELEVQTIRELSYFDAEVISPVVALEWVQDGIKAAEVEAIDWLNSFSDGNTVLRIVPMPFLETLEAFDASALQSLALMALYREDSFQHVLSHPTVSSGITDDWAKIVATLNGVSRTNPQLIDTLLDPEQVTIEERTIDLPLAGDTLLTIIRTSPGAERSMDLLEHAVRQAEDFMGMAFPNRYVGWLVGEAVTPTFGGNNFGTHITTLPRYDIDDDSSSALFAGHLVAHEVAHYYWKGNSNWVDEGVADFMGSVSENARIGRSVEVTNDPCGYVKTIAELEALEVTSEDGSYSAFGCNYSLGERLFLDLYRTLGEEVFSQGLRDLYILSQTVQEDDAEVGIEHVKTAFKNGNQTTDSLIEIIGARWYDGTEPYDTSTQDSDRVNRRFVTVNGGIDVAYLAATRGGPPATSFSARSADDWVRIFLDYSYSVGSNTEVPLEIVVYYEDGFTFDRRTVTFTAEPGYIGATWWLSVGVSPSERWAPGKYEVYVYNEGRKLVELEYEVTQ